MSDVFEVGARLSRATEAADMDAVQDVYCLTEEDRGNVNSV